MQGDWGLLPYHPGSALGSRQRTLEINIPGYRGNFTFKRIVSKSPHWQAAGARHPRRVRYPDSNQSAFAEIAEVSAGRAFDHVDSEFEQANFPGVIHTLDDGAKRFFRVFYMRFRARDHGLNRIAKHALGHIGLAKLESIAEHGDVARSLAHLLDIPLRFLAESLQE